MSYKFTDEEFQQTKHLVQTVLDSFNNLAVYDNQVVNHNLDDDDIDDVMEHPERYYSYRNLNKEMYIKKQGKSNYRIYMNGFYYIDKGNKIDIIYNNRFCNVSEFFESLDKATFEFYRIVHSLTSYVQGLLGL